MSQPQSTSLLWVNKDASNVHRKKHVAEVNAHVQKGGVGRKPIKRSTGRVKDALPNHTVKQDEPTQSSTLVLAGPSGSRSQTPRPDASSLDPKPSRQSGNAFKDAPLPDRSILHTNEATLIFSHYSEDDDVPKQLEGLNIDGDFFLPTEHDDPSRLSDQVELSLPIRLDASNPLPGLLTDLSARDKMLVHTRMLTTRNLSP